jgi:hypothetical protein
MTANVKIPVASAANVTAVPLAAVFTEREGENSQMERFVYVQKGTSFEKRNVKVGVSDFFYAEIQEGLSEGDVVALELPKDEREKKARQVASERGAEGGAAGSRMASGQTGGATNRVPGVAVAPATGSGPAGTPSGNRPSR